MNQMNPQNSIVSVDPREILFIDGERTFPEGENQQRRWMELAIIDGTGASIYHGYFDPGIPVENRFMKKGLTDEVLMFAPTFDSQWLQLKQLMRNKHVVAWWMDMEKSFFPEQLSFCKRLHCAQARFSPLISDYSMHFADYKSVAMWSAFDMLNLSQPPGFRHRAMTDVQAMRLIWNWLEETQTKSLLSVSQNQNPSIPY
jgi:hypothetical protein